jgi:hypothetical protein
MMRKMNWSQFATGLKVGNILVIIHLSLQHNFPYRYRIILRIDEMKKMQSIEMDNQPHLNP